MKFIITKAEDITASTGRKYKKVSLRSDEGEHEGIGIFDNFEAIQVGQELEGTVKQNDRGYWNFYPERKPAGNRTAQMERVMEKKSENVAHAQDRKEHSMRITGASRDASLFVVALINAGQYDDLSKVALRKEWVEWKSWLAVEYGKEGNVPFN